MPEENNNQPAIPSNDYQNHLIWRNIFIYIILPYRFIATSVSFYQHVIDINKYTTNYILFMFLGYFICLISIIIILYGNIQTKPLGYKWLCFYCFFIVIFRIISLVIAFISFIQLKEIIPVSFYKTIHTYFILDTFHLFYYIAIAIINLIYFSHRKFLFGIPDEKSTPPESKEEE